MVHSEREYGLIPRVLAVYGGQCYHCFLLFHGDVPVDPTATKKPAGRVNDEGAAEKKGDGRSEGEASTGTPEGKVLINEEAIVFGDASVTVEQHRYVDVVLHPHKTQQLDKLGVHCN